MKKPTTPNSVRSSHSIPGGVYRIAPNARNTGIMQSRLTMPRLPPALSESQPIRMVLKMQIEPQHSRRGVQNRAERQEHGDHAEQADHAAPAPGLVGEPADQDGAEDARELEDRGTESAILQTRMLDFFQVSGAPIEHAVARDVDEEIRHGEQPQGAIGENVSDQQFACAEFLFPVASALGRIIVAIIFHRRQDPYFINFY